jgi:hypothetical protein
MHVICYIHVCFILFKLHCLLDHASVRIIQMYLRFFSLTLLPYLKYFTELVTKK